MEAFDSEEEGSSFHNSKRNPILEERSSAEQSRRQDHGNSRNRNNSKQRNLKRSSEKMMVHGPSSFPFIILFLCSSFSLLLSTHSIPIPINLPKLSSPSFEEGYNQLFGDRNLRILSDGKTIHLSLDERTGSGFNSQDLYLHGFFSASVKLPSDYAAGVVVAFYMSNGDVFEKNHDELDFEFLGNIRGREWRVQTNIYGNGSTGFGREERYGLWFDPTEDFHNYTILWSDSRIIFYIDNIPIREVLRTETIGSGFPSKPMSLYATIWDGSTWATAGGRYKVNYKYAPFIAEFKDLILHGCAVDPIEHLSACNKHESNFYDSIKITYEQLLAMQKFRHKHMTYSYCYDRERYPSMPLECSNVPYVFGVFDRAGHNRLGHRNRHRKHDRSTLASLREGKIALQNFSIGIA